MVPVGMIQKIITTKIMYELVSSIEFLEKTPKDKKDPKAKRESFLFGS